jgi:hypothetical protein
MARGPVYYTATRLIAISAALVTLSLMTYMAQPWGDNYPYQSLSGYAWLLGYAVWATLPYLMLLFMAQKAFPSKVIKFINIVGTLVVTFGGVALYLDAAFLHRDPQGGLVFIAVPLYQWIALAFLAGIHVLFRKSQS